MSRKTRAIRDGLARMGMQAAPAAVVAALAESGTSVTEEQVRRVKLELLMAEARAGRRRVKPVAARPPARRPPRIPPPRNRRP